MRRLIPLLLLFCLCACGTVHSPVPFGQDAFALDPGEWNGTWCAGSAVHVSRSAPATAESESACVRVTVVDPAAGVIDVLMPPESDDPPALVRAYLRAVDGNGTEAFMWKQGDGDFEFVGRVRRDGNLLTEWNVRDAGFVEGVKAGRLPGRTEDSDAWLGAIDQSTAALIAADQPPRFFDWRSPLTFVRMGD